MDLLVLLAQQELKVAWVTLGPLVLRDSLDLVATPGQPE